MEAAQGPGPGFRGMHDLALETIPLHEAVEIKVVVDDLRSRMDDESAS